MYLCEDSLIRVLRRISRTSVFLREDEDLEELFKRSGNIVYNVKHSRTKAPVPGGRWLYACIVSIHTCFRWQSSNLFSMWINVCFLLYQLMNFVFNLMEMLHVFKLKSSVIDVRLLTSQILKHTNKWQRSKSSQCLSCTKKFSSHSSKTSIWGSKVG